MGYSVEFLSIAEVDLDEIIGWYSQIDAKLANDFLAKLDNALLSVQKNPLQFQKIFKSYRKLNLERFPFKLIYRVDGKRLIIIAIIHHKRRAKYWIGRE